MKSTFKKIALLSLFSSVQPALADEPQLTFTTGADYSSGKYGQSEKTNITYTPLIAKYETGRWTLKLTVPWIEIDGPGGVSADNRIVTGTNISNKRVIESGLGDIVASATYSAIQLSKQRIYIDIGAKTKLPTASTSKGLGTGEIDYTLFADIYKMIDKVTIFGTTGYKVLGDPDGVNLRNVWFGSLGTVYKFDKKNSAGAMIDIRQATSDSGTNLQEYTVFYSHKFNDTYKIQTYLVSGETRSSVDIGGGAMLSMSF